MEGLKSHNNKSEIPHPYKIISGRLFRGGGEVKNRDLGTFKVLNEIWSTDRKGVYVNDVKIPNADSNTFKLLNLIYGIDKDSVYSITGAVKEADVSSFCAIDAGYFWDSDQKGIQMIEGYAKDSDKVFHYTYSMGKPKLLKEATAKDFVVMKWGFGSDRAKVYISGRRIKVAEFKSFEILGRFYSKDAANVYYLDRVIKNADPNTFQVEDETRYRGRDKHRIYIREDAQD